MTITPAPAELQTPLDGSSVILVRGMPVILDKFWTGVFRVRNTTDSMTPHTLPWDTIALCSSPDADRPATWNMHVVGGSSLTPECLDGVAHTAGANTGWQVSHSNFQFTCVAQPGTKADINVVLNALKKAIVAIPRPLGSQVWLLPGGAVPVFLTPQLSERTYLIQLPAAISLAVSRQDQTAAGDLINAVTDAIRQQAGATTVRLADGQLTVTFGNNTAFSVRRMIDAITSAFADYFEYQPGGAAGTAVPIAVKVFRPNNW